jgi:hypothetical protein
VGEGIIGEGEEGVQGERGEGIKGRDRGEGVFSVVVSTERGFSVAVSTEFSRFIVFSVAVSAEFGVEMAVPVVSVAVSTEFSRFSRCIDLRFR